MTNEARILALILAAGSALWVLGLVRSRRLYVGYAAILLLPIGLGAAVAAAPAILGLALSLVGRDSLIVISAAIGIVFLTYVCSQLTLVADRVTATAQEIAIDGAQPVAMPEGPDENAFPPDSRQ